MNFDINGDTVVITTYFNPSSYKLKKINYDKFVSDESMTNANLITIECVFNEGDFELPNSPNCLKIKASSVLWQKERLINLVIKQLPDHITKIVWTDCDLIFENKKWLESTRELLERYNVVQPFELVVQLPYGQHEDNGLGDRYIGFAATFTRNPLSLTTFIPGNRHGHSGYVWAARRESIRHGLYDGCISGNGDHLMAHAFTGDWETECFRPHFEDNDFFWKHFELWCRNTYPLVRSNIGYVSGKLLHLWHGNNSDRKYMDKNRELNAFEFDPAADIAVGDNGTYQWNSNKPDLHRWAERLFKIRNEDGRLLVKPTRQSLIDRLERAKERACSKAHASGLQIIIDRVKNSASIEDSIAITNSALGIKTTS